MTTNKRQEWFQTSADNIQHVVRVDNTKRAERISVAIKTVNGGAGWATVHLTPDEADQLAEMLRLSARDARAQS